MDDGSIPIIGADLDLTKVPALNQQRSVSFLNHFILRTSNFINNFSTMAENELMTQSLEIQNIETALNILEAKLDSIPGLDDIKPATTTATQPKDNASDTANPPTGAETQQPTEQTATTEAQPEASPQQPDPNVVTVRQDPRYAPFLKMVMVGVPKPAVAAKMSMQGLDPDLLDTPDAPVPDGIAPELESDNESQSLSSGDDFSD